MKIYKQGNDVLIGACDENLIGKKFVDGKFQIDVSREFYGGKRVNVEVFKKYLEGATIANLVGKKNSRLCDKNGFSRFKMHYENKRRTSCPNG